VSADLPFGYKFAVDDGSGPLQVFVNLQTGIDPGVVTAGSQVSVTGFSSQFDTHYEIDPRFPRDVVVLRR
jgi:DNA/RNA endonuclease YhcR with UshA esterase domain